MVGLVTCSLALQAAECEKVLITSSADGSQQPSYVILPAGFDSADGPVPLIVSLHQWSGDLENRNRPLEILAEERGWIYLFPNFRGPNNNPAACGSELAQQDILDAVDWVKENYSVDSKRVYLTGNSGGGHMTMLMVGRHPKIWAAASAFVGISDLAAWHQKHVHRRYGMMLEAACGGAPGSSPAVDEQYRKRSPLTYLHRAAEVPLEVAAGVHDGYTGSVPIRHSLEAFNTIAEAAKETLITDAEIEQISRKNGRLDNPLASDQVDDETFGRAIYLRRTAGPARVTIFEGGHEGIPTATIAWLEKHSK